MNHGAKTCGYCASKGLKQDIELPDLRVCENPKCKNVFQIPAWRGRQEGKGRFCSRKCVNEYQKTLTGDKNSKYTGRHTKGHYSGYSWKGARLVALERAGNKCEKCDRDLSKVKRFAIHHEIPAHEFTDPEDSHTLDNLKVICQSCHAKEHNLGKTAKGN